MSILIDENTRVLVQGITGKEGARATKYMLEYGTKVVAGVTPGKGGQEVEGVPVYNTVKEAVSKHPEINASLATVPGVLVRDAVLEALAGGIKLINILPEYVRAQDAAVMLAYARKAGARIVGPSSIGIMSPGKVKIGSIGTAEIAGIYKPGPIGVLSKSGGMTSTITLALSNAGYGQSTVVGIGGDTIIGSDFLDLLELFEDDPETKACVMFGEVGGVYEEKVADAKKSGRIKKPIVAIIAGRFTESLPQGTVLGHAGTIVEKGRGGYDSKVNALKEAGVVIAHTVEEIPEKLQALGIPTS